MRRRAPAAALVLALAAVTPAPAVSAGAETARTADVPSSPSPPPSLDERLVRVQERRRALEKEVAGFKQQERSLLGEVERLELEVRLRSEQLQEVRLELARTNALLDATVKRLREIERSIEASRPVLAARARALYKLGELSYVRLLLSVDRPADIFRGYRFVTTLARRDSERFAAFRRDLERQAAARADLERQTQAALELRASVERARRSLDAQRRRKTALLTEIVEKKETNSLYLAELREAEARLEPLLAGPGGGEVAIPIAAFRGALPWPALGKVSVPFGRRKHPKFDTYTVQNGVEIAAPLDSPVTAVHEGIVAFADRFRGYGLMVVVDHGNKHHTLYAHLAEASVEVGERVTAGQPLGLVGASGLEGAGLYFEVRFQGKPEDPEDWLRPQAQPR